MSQCLMSHVTDIARVWTQWAFSDMAMENGLPRVLWTVGEDVRAIFYVEGWFVAWQCH